MAYDIKLKFSGLSLLIGKIFFASFQENLERSRFGTSKNFVELIWNDPVAKERN